ncbi:MAG: type II toxin-antitoxin system ParD family antitoxin [Gemmataceae bacterium]|nr:type II toxin-antitoxin system ParD family antitoxin [Gemmataceae bacterium]
MTITLTPEQEQAVNREVAAGRFTDPADVVAAALRLITARDELRAAIAVGIEQADRGEVGPLSAVETLARIRSRG